MMTYFQATRPGYVRLYHTPEESFWCCTGTGIENHAKYGDSIYFEDGDALWVNLFIPSVLEWRARGVTITQRTTFPDSDTTNLTIGARRARRFALRVRKPAWCEAPSVAINGKPVTVMSDATGYMSFERTWRAGDVVTVRLPMQLRAEPLPGAPQYVAFVYGPIVLAGLLGTDGVTPAAQIIKNERESGNMLNASIDVPSLTGDVTTLVQRLRPVAGQPLTFETVGVGHPRDVRLAPFFRVAHELYTLYWKTQES
jgi:DUF1680 family protein